MNKYKYFIKAFFYFLILFSLTSSINAKQKIPLFIMNQEKVFKKLAKNINDNFPQNIKILVYELNLLNGPNDLENKINQNFNKVILAFQNKYKYSILLEKNISFEEEKIDLENLKKQDELELIALGKYLEQDAVMLSSITLIEGKTKKIWDKISKKWISKKIALIQGNFFNENRNSLLRFSYYFLTD